ncbi:MAG: cytochrome oxidase assembly protein [Chitinophagaceae bacterium]|nr:cytochrome oxidase assembly protein [Chitinophagaceae bacterium]
MPQNLDKPSSKPIAIWLLAGVVMIMIQVLLGGITRLTESGLSITEWKPITGTLPPLNTAEWQVEFDKYKNTDQFRYIHADFTLSDFKFIFFWEWLHRFWARVLGVVFLAGFVYFLVRKKFKQEMIIPMIILFLLGALQGLVGWIMVKSGLVPEKMFVGHIELATHFIAALVLLCYTFWFALSLLVPRDKLVINSSLKKFAITIVCILVIQLIYGAFMSGLKAATAAPTWPDINGKLIPDQINGLSPWWKNLLENKIAIQLIHRSLAYLLTILVFIWTMKAVKIKGNYIFNKTKWLPVFFILLQVVLGILTVITSPFGNNLVWFGLAHQFTAMLFLLTMMWMLFLVRSHIKLNTV